MDDAAVSVEEFLREKEDKYVSIGLDEFLRLYDQHENRMIANMTTMASKNTLPAVQQKTLQPMTYRWRNVQPRKQKGAQVEEQHRSFGPKIGKTR